MIKRELTREELIEQMKFLSGVKNLNESNVPQSHKSSKLLYYKQAPDGRVLGIIEESNKYYIKTTTGRKEKPTVFDFVYIGGVANKLEERCDSYNLAKNRLALKLRSLNEAFGLNTEEEIPLNSDIDKEKEAEAPVVTEPTPEETEVSSDTTTTPESDKETSTETPENIGGGEDNTDTTTDTETSTEPTDTTTDNNDSEDGQKDASEEIQSLIGKLSQAFQEMGDVDDSLAKNALNTIISSTKSGIEKMDDEEKDKLKQRIERNGEKIEESFLKAFDKMVLKEEQSLKEDNEVEDYQKIKDLYKNDELSDDSDDSDMGGDYIILSQYHTDEKPEVVYTAKDEKEAKDFVKDYKQDLGSKRDRFKVWYEKKVGKLQETDSDQKYKIKASFNDQIEYLDGDLDLSEAKDKCDEYKMAFGKGWDVSYVPMDSEEEVEIDDSSSLMEEICSINEKAKKFALSYLNEMNQDKSEMLSEMYDLSEDDMYGKLNEINLQGAFNKVKSFFTGKQVEDILAKQPEIAKDVNDAKEILASGDINKWTEFKVKARKNLVMVMIILKLMGIGSSAFASDYKSIVPDNIKAKVEMVDTKGGDKTPTSGIAGDTKQVADSTLSKLMLPTNVKSEDGGKTYTYTVKTPGASTDLSFQFSARGGDKTGPSIDVNNKKVEADSKEVEKKFQEIKDLIQKVGKVTPEEFKAKFPEIKSAFENRFADSELTLKGDEIVFTHKFLDNDNIAQSNYKTVDNQSITKGDKIPQGTKVVDLLGAKINTQTQKSEEPTSKQAIAISNKKSTIDKTKLSSKIQDRDKIANDLISKLKDAGFDIESDGNYIVVNQKGFFVDKDKASETINELNKWASDNLKIDNMFSLAGQESARGN